MMKIATHNSITGEKGTFLSGLLAPFAKCQSKTLLEQYKAGCRFFDLRIVYYNGAYHGAHGLWRTEHDVLTLLYDLYVEAEKHEDKVYIMTTYEGWLDDLDKSEFLAYCDYMRACYPNFVWGNIYVKYQDDDLKVDWVCIKGGSFLPKNKQDFIPLDGSTWQTWLPIPWLWNKLYTRKHEFNDKEYVFVDFL